MIIPNGPTVGQWSVGSREMTQTASEPSLDVGAWNVVATFLHPLTNAGDREGRRGQPQIMQVNTEAALLRRSPATQICFSADGSFEGARFFAAN